MKRAVRYVRVCLRDAFPLVVDRITAAGTLGPMGLALAHVEASDTLQILTVWWGASAGVYGLIQLAAAPADPDHPPA